MNGVVGLKPHVGSISRRGLIPISHTQDTPGPLTRNVADAALLLEVLRGEDAEDPATSQAPKKNPLDNAPQPPGHLKDLTIGVARNLYSGDSRVERLLEEGIQILQDLGAEVKDPLYLENTMILKMPELEVLLHEFKHGLNRYLSELDGGLEDQPPESLEELIVFNEAHHEQMMPYFGQELFEKAQKRGSLQSEVYQDSLKECRRLSRQQGINALMQQHGLDAFIAPTSGPAWLTDSIHGDPISIETSFTPSAVAGYPGISVPAGFVSGLPVGISFYGSAWSETILLRCAHAFENASKASKPPVLA
jgi:amidase